MDRFTEDDLREMVLRLAHEIRNPLATINSSAQLVEHLTRPEGEIAEYLKSIVDEVGRVDQTVSEMQTYVRLRRGAPAAQRVEDVVRDVMSSRRAAARERNVRLVARPGPEIGLFADPGHVRLALGELLGNALSYAPEGSRVAISWQADDDKVVIHVDDEGPGIPPEHVDRILRPFFSTSTQGTGLGLSIVLKVAQVAGGGLSWNNRREAPGDEERRCGCRFSLSLPVRPPR